MKSLYALMTLAVLGLANLQAQTTQIDLLVVYTAEASIAAGGEASLISKLDAAMAQANLSLVNSETATQLRLVHTAEIAYTESATLSTNLALLQSTNDGVMDNVHTLRTTYGADLTVLLTGRMDTGGIAGVGYLMTPVSSTFAPWAFAVVRQDQATYHSFIHEIGHNLGGAHAVPEVGAGYGAYTYSRGHRFTAGGTEYRSVMAYAPGVRISYFSNPNVSYLGTPTGLTDAADNARTIRNSRTTVAGFCDTVLGDFWMKATALDNCVMLRWPSPMSIGYADNTTQIRFSTNTYPVVNHEGTLAYQGTNNVYVHTNITPGVTHFYTVWVSNDGQTFFAPAR